MSVWRIYMLLYMSVRIHFINLIELAALSVHCFACSLSISLFWFLYIREFRSQIMKGGMGSLVIYYYVNSVSALAFSDC